MKAAPNARRTKKKLLASSVTVVLSMWCVIHFFSVPFHSPLFFSLFFRAWGWGEDEWKVEKAAGEKWKSPNAACFISSAVAKTPETASAREHHAAVAKQIANEKKTFFSLKQKNLRLCRLFIIDADESLKRGALWQPEQRATTSATRFSCFPPTHALREKQRKKKLESSEQSAELLMPEGVKRKIDCERSQAFFCRAITWPAKFSSVPLPTPNRHYSVQFQLVTILIGLYYPRSGIIFHRGFFSLLQEDIVWREIHWWRRSITMIE